MENFGRRSLFPLNFLNKLQGEGAAHSADVETD